MGCQCCRMIKSYIYDPSAVVEVGKSDASGAGGRGSLYQPQSYLGGAAGNGGSGSNKRKEGVSNLAYSKSNEGTLKLEADNNHVNRLAVREQPQQGASPDGGGGLYIIQPQVPELNWTTEDLRRPSQVPVYPDTLVYGSGGGGGSPALPPYRQSELVGWETLTAADDEDEGVGGTPDYPCDTGDEGSVLSVDIHTSTTSVSSTDTRDGLRWPAKTPDASTAESGISVMKSEDEEEEEQERRRRQEEEQGDDVRSVTDSMVAEALAALEAATAGEDFE
ncbi:unnamed protein product [Merluccius merluccius]